MENLLFSGVPILKHIRVLFPSLSETVMVAPVSHSPVSQPKIQHVSSLAMDVNEQKQWWQLEEVNLKYRQILKFGTPQTIAIFVLKIEKFDVTLH